MMLTTTWEKALLATLLLSGLNPLCFAQTFPSGCKSVGVHFQNNQMILEAPQNKPQQKLFLIANQRRNFLTLKTDDKSPLELINNIRPRQFTSLASSENHLTLNCFEKRQRQLTPTDCETSVRVCQYPRVKFSLANSGTYWIVKSNSLRSVLRYTRGKGILVR